jgi:hypothetical protein
MGWFNKSDNGTDAPKLPELPKLPEFSTKNFGEQTIDKLPAYPSNSFGDKFSQNAIKDAVAGKEEVNEGFDANEFADEESLPNFYETGMQTMQRPSKNSASKKSMPKDFNNNFSREIPEDKSFQEIPEQFINAASKVKSKEPIFIRIDKFQESLDFFKKIKKDISEIDKMLGDIKKIKEEEEKELNSWEEEIRTVKQEIEKIDNSIFSKVE